MRKLNRGKNQSPNNSLAIKVAIGFLLILLITSSLTLVLIIKSKEFAFFEATKSLQDKNTTNIDKLAFPVGVNVNQKIIIENPSVDNYVNKHIVSNHTNPDSYNSWFTKLTAKLAMLDWYQNLASPLGRTLIILSGERGEEVAVNFGQILKWDKQSRDDFTQIIASSTPELKDGKFYPGSYLTKKDAAPEEVAQIIIGRFDAEVRSRYTKEVEESVPMRDALIIASLIEREAYDFEDMRYISGIIWNRLFIDMKLQLDASLQYAKGSGANQPWWPKVVPDDKYINSPFNTYQHTGLPPEPIANPSLDAIIAALNPRKTDCYFYFHDQNGQFYCSKTYEEHVAKLKDIYGQGR
ncbi:endolytic transglycosylase MltG [Candidatus Kaiserbacteria bacterium]|nr:endolytic transglycosylase MltG [Candidatus Kaiserbacteria bacterium]